MFIVFHCVAICLLELGKPFSVLFLLRLASPLHPSPFCISYGLKVGLFLAPHSHATVRHGVCLACGIWELARSWRAEASDYVQGSTAGLSCLCAPYGM